MERKTTKKFTDKKKSATFRLMSRDSSADDPSSGGAPAGDRIFVSVDNNPCSAVGTLEDDAGSNDGGDDDPMSMLVDAPGDCDCDGSSSSDDGAMSTSRLPEHLRREILEPGFPDDGYNYLWHLREIRNADGGSAFYQNPKARLDLVPIDVKVYDALRVQVHKAEGDPHDKSICGVAANSVNVRVQKAIDPEVAVLLDDSDLSQFGSEVEDLEEDFVVRANHLEGKEGIVEENLQDSRMPEVMGRVINGSDTPAGQERQIDNGIPHEIRGRFAEQNDDFDDEKPQEHRLLDEQFDLSQTVTSEPKSRKKKLAGIISVALGAANPLIPLKGKEKLPVDYLPRSMKSSAEKIQGGSVSRNEQPRRKRHGQESKEEKKERKATVKEERREARLTKKEMKGLYRCEVQRAQKVAAITGRSSIPLM